MVFQGDFAVSYVEPGGLEVRRREPLARCWGTRFEDVPPVRRLGSFQGQRSFPGLYFAACMSKHVGFESWLERDQFVALDFSPEVLAFSAQPFWLWWTSGGKARRHAPDAFARLVDGTAMVLDVRADDRIEPCDAEAFAVTATACESVGWSYRRVGALDPVWAANVRWLAGFRHGRCLRERYRDRLLAQFASPASLLVGVKAVGDRIAVLPTVFHLMWKGVLVADLSSELLHGSTLVAVAKDQR